MKSLHAACLAHLEARVAEPLEAPNDWARANGVRCKCDHCTALGHFLESPSTETWTLKAAEQLRNRVEGEIRAARADLDVETDRRGRPYSPVCRKNRASYERRVTQRHQDLVDIAALNEEGKRLPGDCIVADFASFGWRHWPWCRSTKVGRQRRGRSDKTIRWERRSKSPGCRRFNSRQVGKTKPLLFHGYAIPLLGTTLAEDAVA